MMLTGLQATATMMVTQEDTAQALGSGDVAVLGTPRLVALAEAATVGALRGHLADGQTSVGTEITLSHLRASGVGAVVTVTAELVEVDGPALRFEVTAVDQAGHQVARGQVQRALVDRERFLARLRSQSSSADTGSSDP